MVKVGRATVTEINGRVFRLGEIEICSIYVVYCSWEGILRCKAIVNNECSCSRTNLVGMRVKRSEKEETRLCERGRAITTARSKNIPPKASS
jgi:hypothetical protein